MKYRIMNYVDKQEDIEIQIRYKSAVPVKIIKKAWKEFSRMFKVKKDY